MSCTVNRQIGVTDFKYVRKICNLYIGHVIRCMYKHNVNGILRDMLELNNSRTDSRRIFKLGGGVEHVTRYG